MTFNFTIMLRTSLFSFVLLPVEKQFNLLTFKKSNVEAIKREKERREGWKWLLLISPVILGAARGSKLGIKSKNL